MAVVAPMLGGWWLDKKLDTTPVLTLVCLGIGCAAGFWLLFKTARKLTKDAEALEKRERQEQRRDDER